MQAAIAYRRTCLLRRRHKEHGFTLTELVMVMMIIGILAVTVLPRLSETSTFQTEGFQSEVTAALRYAHKSAISHRRLVCATLTANSVTLTIASANGATSCGVSLNGPDGNSVFASTSSNLIAPVAGPMFFQPSGIVTADGAGTTVANYTISITGAASINVVGATGYVY